MSADYRVKIINDGYLISGHLDREVGVSVRAHDKILKVARTIADLENQDVLKCDHIREATHYRMLDRPL